MDDDQESGGPMNGIDPEMEVDSGSDAPADGWVMTARAHYDPTEPRDLTTVIVEAIADAKGVPITDIRMPPLYEVVDIEAIDWALFGRPGSSRDEVKSRVEFRYNEFKVRIEDDGRVTVWCRPGDPSLNWK